jgi:hypothetical protein
MVKPINSIREGNLQLANFINKKPKSKILEIKRFYKIGNQWRFDRLRLIRQEALVLKRLLNELVK